LPSNQSPLGALPSRFRRERVLIVGCGDVGARVAGLLHPQVRLFALTSSPHKRLGLRRLGCTPLVGNLDQPATLTRLVGIATRVVHLAPPPLHGMTDPRTQALLRVLSRGASPKALVYGSTSGVYGDCAGDWVGETRIARPQTPRAQRRVQAEALVRRTGLVRRTRVSILRIPGIYAPNREGGTPRARLTKGTPVLVQEQDVYTNHIHADDLARACVRAMWCGRPQRVYNINDDSNLKMGDYFDLAADLYKLPRPPRVTRAEAASLLSPALLSFMGESRRMVNRRMRQELRLSLHYPSVLQGLVA
jgi:nucleoside-diphosphate-sugar epimerase